MNRIVSAASLHLVAPALSLPLCIVYIQSMSALFPFVMGLSLTRRSFYLGTALAGARVSSGSSPTNRQPPSSPGGRCCSECCLLLWATSA